MILELLNGAYKLATISVHTKRKREISTFNKNVQRCVFKLVPMPCVCMQYMSMYNYSVRHESSSLFAFNTDR